MRLARVGFENVLGYLKGGIEAWKKSGQGVAQISEVDVTKLKNDLEQSPHLQVVDVRQPGEYEAGHVPKAINAPLSELSKNISTLNRELPMYVICGSGFRSAIAISLLEKFNFHRLINVSGGTTAWKNASYPLSH
jgi:rhodanese-related sulfurtransferase